MDFTNTASGAPPGGISPGWEQRGLAWAPVGSFAIFNQVFTLITPTPGQLAATPAIARWTPIQLSWAVPAGYYAVLVAQIGKDSALWMTAYDERLSTVRDNIAIAPLFRERTVVTVQGNFASGRILTFSLLPNGGWQRPDVTVVPYNALEVTQ